MPPTISPEASPVNLRVKAFVPSDGLGSRNLSPQPASGPTGCGQPESLGKCIWTGQGWLSLSRHALSRSTETSSEKQAVSQPIAGGRLPQRPCSPYENCSTGISPLMAVSRPHSFIRKHSRIPSPSPSVLHKEDPESQPGTLPRHPTLTQLPHLKFWRKGNS